tara:strand:- start:1048 stop:1251 length:204 start_codon:yes stop_codon:yes gene_type:complete
MINNEINLATDELCKYIINKLGISKSALELGLKRSYLNNAPLPIVMWSYGLITTNQLKMILLWLKEY